jgi:hypothetical protein
VNGENAPAAGGEPAASPAVDGDHQSFDSGVAHVARVYDYWLGGKDNFAVDRAAGDQAIAAYPDIVFSVRANRAFLARVVRYLAGEAGIRQFLDIGTGIPSANNTHEVAQSVAPDTRVVYVDNDPTVLAHARALLTSGPTGVTDYIDADLRDTDKILEAAARTLDFTQPVAIILMAIVHLIGDEDDPYGIIARLLDAVPSGSYLAMSHIASDIETAAISDAGARVSEFHPSQADLPQPCRGLSLLRRPRARRPGRGPDPGVAAEVRAGGQEPGSAVGRSRAQAVAHRVTASRPGWVPRCPGSGRCLAGERGRPVSPVPGHGPHRSLRGPWGGRLRESLAHPEAPPGNSNVRISQVG